MEQLFSKQKVILPQRMYMHNDSIRTNLLSGLRYEELCWDFFFSEVTKLHSLKGMIKCGLYLSIGCNITNRRVSEI